MSGTDRVEEEFDENNPPADIGPIDPKNIPPRAAKAVRAERAPKKPRAPKVERVPRVEKAPIAPIAPKAEKVPIESVNTIASVNTMENIKNSGSSENTIEKPVSLIAPISGIMSLADSSLDMKSDITPMDTLATIAEKVTNEILPVKVEPITVKANKIEEVKPDIKTANPPKSEMQDQTLRVVLMNESAQIPTRGSKYAAGYDLYASQDVSINRNSRAQVPTGIQLAIPFGYYGRIAPRSSLSAKQSIDVGAGVIDSDYRGEIQVLLINNGSTTQSFKKGDRIAQLIIEKIITPDIEVVEALDSTERGTGGFGSTGK